MVQKSSNVTRPAPLSLFIAEIISSGKTLSEALSVSSNPFITLLKSAIEMNPSPSRSIALNASSKSAGCYIICNTFRRY
jgi:hypothetical protein